MGDLIKRWEQLLELLEIGKGGIGQKGGITIIKGGLVTPLETMVVPNKK